MTLADCEHREHNANSLTSVTAIVSAVKSLPSQCKTRLPGKWPPSLTAVTPGMISLVMSFIHLIRFSLSSRQSQLASSAARYSGQSNSFAQSKCVVQKCGWETTIALIPPLDLIKSTVLWSRLAIQSHKMLPAGVSRKIARSPIAKTGSVQIDHICFSMTSCWIWFSYLPRMRPRVVKEWPVGGTNCRGS